MAYNFNRVINRRLPGKHNKWTYYPPDVLPMWVADMDFQAPKPLLDEMRALLDHGVLGYELDAQAAIEAIVTRMKKLYNWKISPEMIIATPGIVKGFYTAARAICVPGEGLLMQPPVYFPFLKTHEQGGLVRQLAPLTATARKGRIDYEIDFDVFNAAFDSENAKTRMFLFCNPHNPIGTTYSRKELTRMAEICLEHNAVICSDEIHSEILLGRARHIPIAKLSPEIEDQTITLVAASKAYNVPGLFCGFAIIPNPELRAKFKGITEREFLHPNSMGLAAARAAFSGKCDPWLSRAKKYLTANRDFLVNYLRKELPEINYTVPQATYLAWLDCNALIRSGKIEGSPFKFFLENAKVALVEGAEFGPGGEGFVRMNFGCPRKTLKEGLERMRRALK